VTDDGRLPMDDEWHTSVNVSKEEIRSAFTLVGKVVLMVKLKGKLHRRRLTLQKRKVFLDEQQNSLTSDTNTI